MDKLDRLITELEGALDAYSAMSTNRTEIEKAGQVKRLHSIIERLRKITDELGLSLPE